MTAARWRLLIAFVVFAGWVGWLGFQALSYGRFPVLSRAQFLVSTIDVIGIVKAEADGKPSPTVNVQEVHWPPDGAGLKSGSLIQVVNLPESTGYKEAGQYVLPLIRDEKSGDYRLAGLPQSPGFVTGGQLFIYPLTPETRQQLDSISKPK